ncbi:MAG: ABC transporter permease [Opitutae bacterium]|nr:ABC transporter permease [Opitutae bacterium]
MLSDLRLALRSLLKSPGFTFVAVATLALCIGANSAIFSVLNAILLKPYPWPGSERLVYVGNVFPKLGGGGGLGNMSVPDYIDHRAGVPSFAESALISGFNANLSFDGNPERVYGLTVTPSLFALLQTRPALGRAFTDAEAEPGAGKTVVLNDPFWKNRFGGDPAIVGKSIRLNGESYTVVGVMPEGFYFPSLRAQFFVPYVLTSAMKSDAQRYNQFSTMLARLRPDTTLASAQRELDAVHRAVRERLPSAREEHEATGYGSAIAGFLEQNVEDVRAMLWILQAGVAAALLIGCANVANLLLARASARSREFAIRSALGAGRARLVRQLLVESLVLFLLGGAGGLLLASWSLDAINTLGVGSLPRGFGVALDARVFAFTLLCALGTGLGFGALPAFASTRGNAAEALKSAGTRATAGRTQLWLRGALAVTQVALSLMLLATSGLLLRSFQRVLEESPGFATDHALTAAVSLPASRYPTPEKRAAFAAQLTDRLASISGVTAAGLTSALPFASANPQGGYQIEGFEPGPGKPNPNGMIRQVSPGYFRAMGIPLLRGRLIELTDTLGRENVVVIDRYPAERYWPGADPIGKRVSRGGGATQGNGSWTIVGVVGTIKHWDLEQAVTKETLYFPYAQTPNVGFTFVVKTTVPPASLLAAVREAVLAIDPDQPIFDIKTLDARLDESLQRRRAPMLLLTVFAGVAVVLASLGIYGVLAFSVGQRTSEFGIRMALGADRASILKLILGQGAGLVLLGLALGLGGYFALSSFIASLLFGVAPTDPATLVAAPVLLALVALTACLLPAHRATQVDPMTALRTE